MKNLLTLCLISLPYAATALDLALPEGSELTVSEATETGSYALPDGPYQDGWVSTRKITGHVTRQVWRYSDGAASTAQLMEPLRRQVQAAGYAVMLDCDAASCGGFDFRFDTEVLPAPKMFVDLRDYRFLSAMRESSSGTDAIGILISRTETAGLTQLIAVKPQAAEKELPLAKPAVGDTYTPVGEADLGSTTDVVKALDLGGHVILRDLLFETGSSTLSAGPFASLEAIARFLDEDPTRRIALVGHTDNVGSLENNINLSKRRAESVRSYLINEHGIAGDRMQSQGVGYLAPVASNKSEEGRTANRRVEAILLSSE